MQKNWYIAYTKSKCEKKVAALLTKRKIENFCPINCKQIKHLIKNKLFLEPLFTSYVFLNIKENDFFQLKNVEGIVSLVYWKGRPAVVKDDEIEVIREFITYHRDIKLERTSINVNDAARIVDGPSYAIDGKILMIKNRSFSVNLPSLGYTMIAEMEAEGISGREITFGNKELLLQ